MQAIENLQTVLDFIRWGASSFNRANLYYGHGTDNAWDEAVVLVLHGLHLPHSVNPLFTHARLTTAEKEKLYTLITERIDKRIPAAYLTHEAWFAGLSFYVDSRVLVPRSPMAELIENEFQPWLSADTLHSVLDLCTGSGCIAIACAKMLPHAHVVATDISVDALAVAKINVTKHEVEEQVTLVQSNIFAGLGEQKFDLIISNPPYVDAMDMASLPKEYLHEPALGLAAGDDGLTLVKKILRHALNHLTPHGHLIVEVGNSEAALCHAFPTIPFTWLEFARGGNGVFLLSAETLSHCVNDL